MFCFSLSAQITKEEADSIVIERMYVETKPCTIYAKEDLQAEGYTIETSNEEILELDYSAWVYYLNYASEAKSKYLIVKEENGNLLEINIKNSDVPNDLINWEVVLINLPYEPYFTSHFWMEDTCYWIYFQASHIDSLYEVIIINSYEEMENYYFCDAGNTMPNIDFSEHTLLLARGVAPGASHPFSKSFVQLSLNNYVLHVDICVTCVTMSFPWATSIIISKLEKHSVVELNVEEVICN